MVIGLTMAFLFLGGAAGVWIAVTLWESNLINQNITCCERYKTSEGHACTFRGGDWVFGWMDITHNDPYLAQITKE